MNALLTLANWLVPLIYLGFVIDYGATFFLRIRTHVRNQWVPAAIVFHAAFLVLRGIKLGYPPVVSGYEILSLIALSSACVYWVMELISRDRRAGAFVFLLIFLFQYTSSTFLAHDIATSSAEIGTRYGWARLHVVPAVLAYTALTFAAVYGLLHLIGQRYLKQHHFGLFFDRLPPLELLGKLSWFALVVGLLFMTVSMVTGTFMFSQAKGVQQSEGVDPKVISKIVIGSIAWLICLTAVIGKLFGRWSTSRVSFITVTGFLAIVALLAISIILS